MSRGDQELQRLDQVADEMEFGQPPLPDSIPGALNSSPPPNIAAIKHDALSYQRSSLEVSGGAMMGSLVRKSPLPLGNARAAGQQAERLITARRYNLEQTFAVEEIPQTNFQQMADQMLQSVTKDPGWMFFRYLFFTFLILSTIGVFVVIFLISGPLEMEEKTFGPISTSSAFTLNIKGCSFRVVYSGGEGKIDATYHAGDVDFDAATNTMNINSNFPCSATLSLAAGTVLNGFNAFGNSRSNVTLNAAAAAMESVTSAAFYGDFMNVEVLSVNVMTKFKVNATRAFVRCDNMLWPAIDGFVAGIDSGDVVVSTKQSVAVSYVIPTDFTCLTAPLLRPPSCSSVAGFNGTVLMSCSASLGNTSLVDLNSTALAGMTITLGEGEIHIGIFDSSGLLQDEDTATTRWGGDKRVVSVNATQIDDLQELFVETSLSAVGTEMVVMNLLGPGAVKEPQLWVWAVSTIYLRMDLNYLRVVSLSLLSPITEYFEARLFPGYCPNYLASELSTGSVASQRRLLLTGTELADLEEQRRIDNYRVLQEAIAQSGGILGFQKDSTGPYMYYEFNQATLKWQEVSLNFASDTLLVLMTTLGATLAFCLSLGTVIVGVKLIHRRWDSEYKRFVKEAQLSSIVKSASPMEEGVDGGGGGAGGFLQQKGIFWYMQIEMERFIAAQVMKNANADIIQGKTANKKAKKKTKNKVEKVEAKPLSETIAEPKPQKTWRVLLGKIARVALHVGKQVSSIFAIYVVYIALGLMLVLAAFLYESGQDQITLRAATSAFFGFGMMFGYLEFSLHLLQFTKWYNVRAWIQYFFHRYFVFMVFINLAGVWLVVTWVILGLIVNPTRALPYATAVLTLGGHTLSAYRKLEKRKNQVKSAFQKAFEAITSIVPVDIKNFAVSGIVTNVRNHVTGMGGEGGAEMTPQMLLSNVLARSRQAMSGTDETEQTGKMYQQQLAKVVSILLHGLRSGQPQHSILKEVLEGPVADSIGQFSKHNLGPVMAFFDEVLSALSVQPVVDRLKKAKEDVKQLKMSMKFDESFHEESTTGLSFGAAAGLVSLAARKRAGRKKESSESESSDDDWFDFFTASSGKRSSAYTPEMFEKGASVFFTCMFELDLGGAELIAPDVPISSAVRKFLIECAKDVDELSDGEDVVRNWSNGNLNSFLRARKASKPLLLAVGASGMTGASLMDMDLYNQDSVIPSLKMEYREQLMQYKKEIVAYLTVAQVQRRAFGRVTDDILPGVDPFLDADVVFARLTRPNLVAWFLSLGLSNQNANHLANACKDRAGEVSGAGLLDIDPDLVRKLVPNTDILGYRDELLANLTKIQGRRKSAAEISLEAIKNEDYLEKLAEKARKAAQFFVSTDLFSKLNSLLAEADPAQQVLDLFGNVLESRSHPFTKLFHHFLPELQDVAQGSVDNVMFVLKRVKEEFRFNPRVTAVFLDTLTASLKKFRSSQYEFGETEYMVDMAKTFMRDLDKALSRMLFGQLSGTISDRGYDVKSVVKDKDPFSFVQLALGHVKSGIPRKVCRPVVKDLFKLIIGKGSALRKARISLRKMVELGEKPVRVKLVGCFAKPSGIKRNKLAARVETVPSMEVLIMRAMSHAMHPLDSGLNLCGMVKRNVRNYENSLNQMSEQKDSHDFESLAKTLAEKVEGVLTGCGLSVLADHMRYLRYAAREASADSLAQAKEAAEMAGLAGKAARDKKKSMRKHKSTMFMKDVEKELEKERSGNRVLGDGSRIVMALTQMVSKLFSDPDLETLLSAGLRRRASEACDEGNTQELLNLRRKLSELVLTPVTDAELKTVRQLKSDIERVALDVAADVLCDAIDVREVFLGIMCRFGLRHQLAEFLFQPKEVLATREEGRARAEALVQHFAREFSLGNALFDSWTKTAFSEVLKPAYDIDGGVATFAEGAKDKLDKLMKSVKETTANLTALAATAAEAANKAAGREVVDSALPLQVVSKVKGSKEMYSNRTKAFDHIDEMVALLREETAPLFRNTLKYAIDFVVITMNDFLRHVGLRVDTFGEQISRGLVQPFMAVMEARESILNAQKHLHSLEAMAIDASGPVDAAQVTSNMEQVMDAIRKDMGGMLQRDLCDNILDPSGIKGVWTLMVKCFLPESSVLVAKLATALESVGMWEPREEDLVNPGLLLDRLFSERPKCEEAKDQVIEELRAVLDLYTVGPRVDEYGVVLPALSPETALDFSAVNALLSEVLDVLATPGDIDEYSAVRVSDLWVACMPQPRVSLARIAEKVYAARNAAVNHVATKGPDFEAPGDPIDFVLAFAKHSLVDGNVVLGAAFRAAAGGDGAGGRKKAVEAAILAQSRTLFENLTKRIVREDYSNVFPSLDAIVVNVKDRLAFNQESLGNLISLRKPLNRALRELQNAQKLTGGGIEVHATFLKQAVMDGLRGLKVEPLMSAVTNEQNLFAIPYVSTMLDAIVEVIKADRCVPAEVLRASFFAFVNPNPKPFYERAVAIMRSVVFAIPADRILRETVWASLFSTTLLPINVGPGASDDIIDLVDPTAIEQRVRAVVAPKLDEMMSQLFDGTSEVSMMLKTYIDRTNAAVNGAQRAGHGGIDMAAARVNQEANEAKDRISSAYDTLGAGVGSGEGGSGLELRVPANLLDPLVDASSFAVPTPDIGLDYIVDYLRSFISNGDLEHKAHQLLGLSTGFFASTFIPLVQEAVTHALKTAKSLDAKIAMICNRIAKLIDKIKDVLDDTPVQYLDTFLDSILNQLKEPFVFHSVVEGMIKTIGNVTHKSLMELAWPLFAEMVRFVQDAHDRREQITFLDLTKISIETIAVNAKSTASEIILVMARSVVPFELLVQLAETLTVLVGVLRDFVRDFRDGNVTELNLDSLVAALEQVAVLVLQYLDVKSLVAKGLLPLMSKLMDSLNLTQMKDELFGGLVDMALTSIVPEVVELLPRSAEFREAIATILSADSFALIEPLSFLAPALNILSQKVSGSFSFDIIIGEMITAFQRMTDMYTSDYSGENFVQDDKSASLHDILDPINFEYVPGKPMSDYVSEYTSKVAEECLLPHFFEALASEMAFSSTSLTEGLISVLVSMLRDEQKRLMKKALDPLKRTETYLRQLVETEAADILAVTARDMKRHDLFLSVLDVMVEADLPGIGPLVRLFGRLYPTTVPFVVLDDLIDGAYKRFVLQRGPANIRFARNFLLKQLSGDMGISLEHDLSEAVLQAVDTDTLYSHVLTFMTKSIEKMIKSGMATIVGASTSSIERDLSTAPEKMAVLKKAIGEAGKMFEEWTKPVLDLYSTAADYAIGSMGKDFAARHLEAIILEITDVLPPHVKTKLKLDISNGSVTDARGAILSLFTEAAKFLDGDLVHKKTLKTLKNIELSLWTVAEKKSIPKIFRSAPPISNWNVLTMTANEARYWAQASASDVLEEPAAAPPGSGDADLGGDTIEEIEENHAELKIAMVKGITGTIQAMSLVEPTNFLAVQEIRRVAALSADTFAAIQENTAIVADAKMQKDRDVIKTCDDAYDKLLDTLLALTNVDGTAPFVHIQDVVEEDSVQPVSLGSMLDFLRSVTTRVAFPVIRGVAREDMKVSTPSVRLFFNRFVADGEKAANKLANKALKLAEMFIEQGLGALKDRTMSFNTAAVKKGANRDESHISKMRTQMEVWDSILCTALSVMVDLMNAWPPADSVYRQFICEKATILNMFPRPLEHPLFDVQQSCSSLAYLYAIDQVRLMGDNVVNVLQDMKPERALKAVSTLPGLSARPRMPAKIEAPLANTKAQLEALAGADVALSGAIDSLLGVFRIGVPSPSMMQRAHEAIDEVDFNIDKIDRREGEDKIKSASSVKLAFSSILQFREKIVNIGHPLMFLRSVFGTDQAAEAAIAMCSNTTRIGLLTNLIHVFYEMLSADGHLLSHIVEKFQQSNDKNSESLAAIIAQECNSVQTFGAIVRLYGETAGNPRCYLETLLQKVKESWSHAKLAGLFEERVVLATNIFRPRNIRAALHPTGSPLFHELDSRLKSSNSALKLGELVIARATSSVASLIAQLPNSLSGSLTSAASAAFVEVLHNFEGQFSTFNAQKLESIFQRIMQCFSAPQCTVELKLAAKAVINLNVDKFKDIEKLGNKKIFECAHELLNNTIVSQIVKVKAKKFDTAEREDSLMKEVNLLRLDCVELCFHYARANIYDVAHAQGSEEASVDSEIKTYTELMRTADGIELTELQDTLTMWQNRRVNMKKEYDAVIAAYAEKEKAFIEGLTDDAEKEVVAQFRGIQQITKEFREAKAKMGALKSKINKRTDLPEVVQQEAHMILSGCIKGMESVEATCMNVWPFHTPETMTSSMVDNTFVKTPEVVHSRLILVFNALNKVAGGVVPSSSKKSLVMGVIREVKKQVNGASLGNLVGEVLDSAALLADGQVHEVVEEVWRRLSLSLDARKILGSLMGIMAGARDTLGYSVGFKPVLVDLIFDNFVQNKENILAGLPGECFKEGKLDEDMTLKSIFHPFGEVIASFCFKGICPMPDDIPTFEPDYDGDCESAVAEMIARLRAMLTGTKAEIIAYCFQYQRLNSGLDFKDYFTGRFGDVLIAAMFRQEDGDNEGESQYVYADNVKKYQQLVADGKDDQVVELLSEWFYELPALTCVPRAPGEEEGLLESGVLIGLLRGLFEDLFVGDQFYAFFEYPNAQQIQDALDQTLNLQYFWGQVIKLMSRAPNVKKIFKDATCKVVQGVVIRKLNEYVQFFVTGVILPRIRGVVDELSAVDTDAGLNAVANAMKGSPLEHFVPGIMKMSNKPIGRTSVRAVLSGFAESFVYTLRHNEALFAEFLDEFVQGIGVTLVEGAEKGINAAANADPTALSTAHVAAVAGAGAGFAAGAGAAATSAAQTAQNNARGLFERNHQLMLKYAATVEPQRLILDVVRNAVDDFVPKQVMNLIKKLLVMADVNDLESAKEASAGCWGKAKSVKMSMPHIDEGTVLELMGLFASMVQEVFTQEEFLNLAVTIQKKLGVNDEVQGLIQFLHSAKTGLCDTLASSLSGFMAQILRFADLAESVAERLLPDGNVDENDVGGQILQIVMNNLEPDSSLAKAVKTLDDVLDDDEDDEGEGEENGDGDGGFNLKAQVNREMRNVVDQTIRKYVEIALGRLEDRSEFLRQFISTVYKLLEIFSNKERRASFKEQACAEVMNMFDFVVSWPALARDLVLDTLVVLEVKFSSELLPRFVRKMREAMTNGIAEVREIAEEAALTKSKEVQQLAMTRTAAVVDDAEKKILHFVHLAGKLLTHAMAGFGRLAGTAVTIEERLFTELFRVYKMREDVTTETAVTINTLLSAKTYKGVADALIPDFVSIIIECLPVLNRPLQQVMQATDDFRLELNRLLIEIIRRIFKESKCSMKMPVTLGRFKEAFKAYPLKPSAWEKMISATVQSVFMGVRAGIASARAMTPRSAHAALRKESLSDARDTVEGAANNVTHDVRATLDVASGQVDDAEEYLRRLDAQLMKILDFVQQAVLTVWREAQHLLSQPEAIRNLAEKAEVKFRAFVDDMLHVADRYKERVATMQASLVFVAKDKLREVKNIKDPEGALKVAREAAAAASHAETHLMSALDDVEAAAGGNQGEAFLAAAGLKQMEESGNQQIKNVREIIRMKNMYLDMCQNTLTSLADKLFKDALPSVVNEMFDMLINPRKGQGTVWKVAMEEGLTRMCEMLAASPFYFVSELLERARHVLSQSDAYAKVVLEGARESLVNVIADIPTDFRVWISALKSLLDPTIGPETFIRTIGQAIDYKTVVKTVGEEMLRALFNPLQPMVSSLLRPLISPCVSNSEELATVQTKALGSIVQKMTASIEAEMLKPESENLFSVQSKYDAIGEKVLVPLLKKIRWAVKTFDKTEGFIMDFTAALYKFDLGKEAYPMIIEMLMGEIKTIVLRIQERIVAAVETAGSHATKSVDKAVDDPFAFVQMLMGALSAFQAGDIEEAVDGLSARAVEFFTSKKDLMNEFDEELLLQETLFEGTLRSMVGGLFTYLVMEKPRELWETVTEEHRKDEIVDNIAFQIYSKCLNFLKLRLWDVWDEIAGLCDAGCHPSKKALSRMMDPILTLAQDPLFDAWDFSEFNEDDEEEGDEEEGDDGGDDAEAPTPSEALKALSDRVDAASTRLMNMGAALEAKMDELPANIKTKMKEAVIGFSEGFVKCLEVQGTEHPLAKEVFRFACDLWSINPRTGKLRAEQTAMDGLLNVMNDGDMVMFFGLMCDVILMISDSEPMDKVQKVTEGLGDAEVARMSEYDVIKNYVISSVTENGCQTLVAEVTTMWMSPMRVVREDSQPDLMRAAEKVARTGHLVPLIRSLTNYVGRGGRVFMNEFQSKLGLASTPSFGKDLTQFVLPKIAREVLTPEVCDKLLHLVLKEIGALLKNTVDGGEKVATGYSKQLVGFLLGPKGGGAMFDAITLDLTTYERSIENVILESGLARAVLGDNIQEVKNMLQQALNPNGPGTRDTLEALLRAYIVEFSKLLAHNINNSTEKSSGTSAALLALLGTPLDARQKAESLAAQGLVSARGVHEIIVQQARKMQRLLMQILIEPINIEEGIALLRISMKALLKKFKGLDDREAIQKTIMQDGYRLLQELPGHAEQVFSAFGSELRTHCISKHQSESSRYVKEILSNSQSTLATIDQFLGSATEVIQDGKRVLDSVDEKLNKGFTFVVDQVYAEVKREVPSISKTDTELREHCKKTTEDVMRRKVSSVFGVTSQQLAAALVSSVAILLMLFAFIFFGVQVFRGKGAIVSLINTGMVVAAGGITTAGQSSDSNQIFTEISPKIRAFLMSNLDMLLGAALTDEIIEASIVGLMHDDDTLREIVREG